jgi:hypothetical protein
MRNSICRACVGVLGIALVLSEPAWGQVKGSLFGVDFATSGYLRTDIAVNTNDDPNPYNQFGDPFNKVTVTRTPGNPGLPVDGIDILEPILRDGLPFAVPLGVLTDEIQRPQKTVKNTFNYNVLRWEQQLELRFSSALRFVAQTRALYNLRDYDDSFDARDFTNSQGMIEGGVPRLYHGEPNQYEYLVDGDNHPQRLEITGRDYFVDFPALMFEYSKGPFMLRAGNQRIAWGQALFFRVMDKVDGLDLRRHLILDRALEEYSDERVPSLGLRLTSQVGSTIVADAYVKKFQPSVLPNPNTPYNVIPTQFTVHDQYALGGYDDKVNYGIRLKGDYGFWGWQAMALRRYNDAGVFRWTETGVDKDLPNTNLLGAVLNTYCAVVLNAGTGCGPLLAQTAFEVAPTPVSVVSADEWFWYAADVRLGGISALNAAIDEFPAAQQILARSVGDDFERAHRELSAFFQASEGLRGHIARDYYQENVFGLGGSYVTETDEPGSFFNQIIFNLEVAYTPERAFTPLSLSQKPLLSDETEIAFVAEKYHRFTSGFPATYLVFQAMHKTESDLFGRHLSGYGGEAVKGRNTEKAVAPGVSGGATYVAFAFLQPWPAYIWELSAAVLADVRGGVLIQPGLKWKPSGAITVEGFYNFIDGTTWNDNPNDSTISTADFMNEFTMRFTYQF